MLPPLLALFVLVAPLAQATVTQEERAWVRVLGGAGADVVTGITTAADGSLYVVGYGSFGQPVRGNGVAASPEDVIRIAKFTSTGRRV